MGDAPETEILVSISIVGGAWRAGVDRKNPGNRQSPRHICWPHRREQAWRLWRAVWLWLKFGEVRGSAAITAAEPLCPLCV